MPATAATPLSFVPATRLNSGLIFDTSGRQGGRRGGHHMTARRDAGVGSPTISGSAADRSALLVLEACEAALSAISSLEAQARDVARRFRFAPGVDAQRGLAQLVESTQTLLRLASMTASVAHVDLEQLCAGCGQAGIRLQEAVASAIRAQLVTDWEALAATLEADLAGALSSWRRVFRAIAAPFDSGPGGYAA